jgi:hypothetical protein
MFGFIALFAFHTMFRFVESVFCFRMCCFLFVCIVCLWDGFMFIYRFRFIFLADGVRSRVEYETQFEFFSFKFTNKIAWSCKRIEQLHIKP